MDTHQPDIFIVISDDHSWFDAGCYGSRDIHTPHLDRLAAEGTRLDCHSTPTPICAPARMALYTGIFPVRNGAWPNHSHAYAGTRSIVHHLRGLGYRVGLHGKKHFGPEEVFPFEQVDDIPAFVQRSNTEPYCLVVATREPHAPWGALDTELYQPSRLTLAPYLVDTPGTRDILARYSSDVTRLDKHIGGYLEIVSRHKRADNTLFIYTSDHGTQFPGGKWTCYEPGLRVPFVLRWPRRIAPGTVCSALTQHVDVLPTLLEAAGAPDGNRGFDGSSFLPALLGRRATHRDYAFGVQTQQGTINGLPYPVRSVRNERYKYIANLCHGTGYRNVITGAINPAHENAYWHEWLASAKTDARASFLVERYLHRPPEELYDLQADPWELKNLAADPALADVKQSLSQTLSKWMKQQGDQGIETEMKAMERQKG